MRVKKGFKARRRRNRVLKLAKGFRGRRGNCYKRANQAVERALNYSTRDRRQKRRDFRALFGTPLGRYVSPRPTGRTGSTP